MAHVALTGANGFLGWHSRAALLEAGIEARGLVVGDGFDADLAETAISGAARLVHLAGVNRGTDEEVRDGNKKFAHQVAESLVRSDEPPRVVVYANSTQANNGSVYGDAKSAAADLLGAAAARVGAEFQNIVLPNLFGEHGRPFYNAVTATFSHLLAQGETPVVEHDKNLTLLHAQHAAELLLGLSPVERLGTLEVQETVSGLLARLKQFSEMYRHGEIPDIATTFSRDLFNTYRSYTFPSQVPVPLLRHADARGSFFEIIRSHGGSGQSSFSTTAPGISRGITSIAVRSSGLPCFREQPLSRCESCSLLECSSAQSREMYRLR
jgi:UDP-2-acetamido-2,6-beta-L-arabino-hexul-4-ose reductase